MLTWSSRASTRFRGLIIREISNFILDKCQGFETNPKAKDLDRYIALLFVRDAIVTKNPEFLKQLIAHPVLEVLMDNVSMMSEAKSIKEAHAFLKDKSLNESYCKTLLMLFYEAAEVEAKLRNEDLTGDIQDLVKGLDEMNVPFYLVKNDPMIFLHVFREEENQEEEQILEKTEDELKIMEKAKETPRPLKEIVVLSQAPRPKATAVELGFLIRATGPPGVPRFRVAKDLFSLQSRLQFCSQGNSFRAIPGSHRRYQSAVQRSNSRRGEDESGKD